jgi:hypothetical protein
VLIKGNKLNQLLQHWQSGGLFISSWLKKNGYSDQLMQQYRKSDWFSLLSKGVMYRTGDKPPSYMVAIQTYLPKKPRITFFPVVGSRFFSVIMLP